MSQVMIPSPSSLGNAQGAPIEISPHDLPPEPLSCNVTVLSLCGQKRLKKLNPEANDRKFESRHEGWMMFGAVRICSLLGCEARWLRTPILVPRDHARKVL